MAQAKLRVVDKDPSVKLARQRMGVLQLAQALGSVSAACRRAGMGWPYVLQGVADALHFAPEAHPRPVSLGTAR